MIILWLGSLAVLVVKGGDSALSRQALVQKGTSMAAIPARTAAGLIANYDFDTLGVLAQCAVEDADFVFAAFHDAEGALLTELKDNPIGFDVVKKTVEVGICDTAIRATMQALGRRFDAMMAAANGCV